MTLIGLDLDGVLAIENNTAYNQALKDGASAIKHYYENLQPDKFIVALVRRLVSLHCGMRGHDNVRLRLYTARSCKYHPELISITYNWLIKHQLISYFDQVVFTRFRWKYEVLLDDCAAMIDNDIVMLSRLPGVDRYAYKPFYRLKYQWFKCKLLTSANALDDVSVLY